MSKNRNSAGGAAERAHVLGAVDNAFSVFLGSSQEDRRAQGLCDMLAGSADFDFVLMSLEEIGGGRRNYFSSSSPGCEQAAASALGVKRRSEAPPLGDIVPSHDRLFIDNNFSAAGLRRALFNSGSMALFPVPGGKSPLGGIFFFSSEKNAFTAEIISRLQNIVRQAGLSIQEQRRELRARGGPKSAALNRKRLQALLETTSDGVWEWSPSDDKMRVRVRPKKALRGSSRPGSGYVPVTDIVRPEEMESFKAALQKHIRGGSDVFDYVSEMTSGGRTKYILIRGAAQRDRRGNPVLVFGSFEDITEKMRFSELKEASEFTRILMDSIPHPICCKGPDLKYMACNMAFELLFSATAEEIKGKTAADFLSPEDAAETFEIDRKLLRRGGMAANERRLFLPTLGERIVIETKSVFYDGGGAVGGIISCDIDITERKQAELALRESEERFRIVAEFSTEMIYWLDSAGVIRYISPNCAELTGFSAEEFVADPLLLEKMVVGEDSGCLCEFKLNTGARASVDVRVRSKDGVVKWMRHSCKPVLGDGGAPMGCRGSFSDITMLKHLEVELTRARDKLEDRVFAATKELKDVNRHLTEEIHLRRLTEESLRLSEQRFRTIAEASPIALLITSISSGAILFANDQALQLFKVDPANLTLTKPVSHYCCPEDRKNLLDEVVKTGKIDNREVRFKRTDGSVFTGAVSMKTAWFQGERAVFAGLTDITEQKITESSLAMTINELQNEMLARGRAEDALRESERRHRALAETAPVGIWQLDSDSRITFINPKMTEMLALDAAGAALGKSSFDFVGKNSLEAVRSARDRNFGGDSYDYEAELLPCSGSAVSALVSGKNILSRSGDILMRIEIFTDITARKIAEREAEQRRLQLIQADKMISLGILVAGVAHEINNPVNFIMLNAPILKEIWRDSLPAIINYHGENPNFSPAGLSFDEMMSITPSLFKGIEEGVDRIRSIVSGLKNYAKRDSNELNEKISVNDVVHSSMLLLSNMIKKSTRNLKLSLAEDLPRVNGNFQRLEQVVINIVQNACQALPAPDKGIKISTSFLRAENKIFLTVEDQGVGIPEDNLAFVKDPFFTTKRDSGGTGLGLSISESIIKEHGGELAVSSRPGQGAEVKIWLPASAWEES